MPRDYSQHKIPFLKKIAKHQGDGAAPSLLTLYLAQLSLFVHVFVPISRNRLLKNNLSILTLRELPLAMWLAFWSHVAVDPLTFPNECVTAHCAGTVHRTESEDTGRARSA